MITTCHYLFERGADEVFPNIPPENREPFIERCLDLMIRVNTFLLKERQGFFLIDPATLNNQCHLHALKAYQIERLSRIKELTRGDEHRFLHLSLFLHRSLMEGNTLLRVVRTTLEEMGEKMILPKRTFKRFIHDEGHHREKAARLALNNLFEKKLKEELKPQTPLYQELYGIAHENLQLTSTRGAKFGTFFTYPKLAGVVFLIDTIARENIPFVLKVKVMREEGVAGVIVKASRTLEANEPVLLFEGIAHEKPLIHYKAMSAHCPSSPFPSNKKHGKEESCPSCTLIEGVDLTTHEERMDELIKHPEEMFYALGSDFTLEGQKKFIPHFVDTEKYPLLSKIFEESVVKVDRLGVGTKHPSTFAVCHVSLESSSRALSPKVITFLQESGL